MHIWDYDIPQNWKPQTDPEWEWYLVRKINYGDFKGLTKTALQKYFPNIKRLLDPGKRDMFEYYLKKT